ncbi:hypothetical protein HY993_00690 [Candidatus Micrarchaeota archaeon]|nr:hypothetical protein [Candidatus Micrarchaeota archaeon]
MNVNVHFAGLTDEIIQDAIRKGLANTKTEVLRLGLFELKNKYDLAQGEPTQEEKKLLASFLSSLKKSDFKTEKELWAALK